MRKSKPRVVDGAVNALKGNYTRDLRAAETSTAKREVWEKYAEKFKAYGIALPPLPGHTNEPDMRTMSKTNKLRHTLYCIGKVFNSTVADLAVYDNETRYSVLEKAIKETFEELTEDDLKKMPPEVAKFIRELGWKSPTDYLEEPDAAEPVDVKLTYEIAATHAILASAELEITDEGIYQKAYAFYKDNSEAVINDKAFDAAIEKVIKMFVNPKVGYLVKQENGAYRLNINAEVR